MLEVLSDPQNVRIETEEVYKILEEQRSESSWWSYFTTLILP